LESDVSETKNVVADHPDIVAQLQKLADEAREDLGDAHQKKLGKNRRAAGRVE